MKKFDSIISKLKKRGHVVRKRASNLLTFPFDAIVGNVVILKTPSFSMPTKVSKMAFQRKIAMLEKGGYKPFIVPNGRLSEEQVKAFVDSIEAALDGKEEPWQGCTLPCGEDEEGRHE